MNEGLFIRNIGTVTKEEQARLHSSTALIVGCGGLGGFCAELCSRAGIGKLILIDGDCFEQSNTNRQIGCTVATLGKGKAAATKKRLLSINPELEVTAFKKRITARNAGALLKGVDIVIDGLDNIESRLIVEKACSKQKIPFIFGAVSGYGGYVGVDLPKYNLVADLYEGVTQGPPPSVMSFTVAAVAALQCAEAVKVLLNKATAEKQLLMIDLLDGSIRKVKMT